MASDRENTEKTLQGVNIQTSLDKVVPKFCTGITIGLLNTKNVVLTMTYNEGSATIALIERIVIDLDHARSLSDNLNRLLGHSENV